MKHPLILLSLVLPSALFTLQILAEALLSQTTLSSLHSEWGPHETFQAMLTTAGFFIASITSFQIIKLPARPYNKNLFGYLVLAALCCFYVTGEEISWGQHIFDWGTPEYWNAINDQGETNLHNSSSFLDQKPRLLLLIGITLGGLILPTLSILKINPTPEKLRIILPHGALSLCAFLTILMSILDKIDEQLKTVVIFERSSEVQEVFMFLFVVLYLLFLRQRIFSAQKNNNL
jgi:hypothetical protein